MNMGTHRLQWSLISRGNMANLDAVLEQLRNEREKAKTELDQLDRAISVLEGGGRASSVVTRRSGRKTMSADARRRIGEAQRRRWAKVKGAGQKRTLSPAARRRIAAAQKARWAKLRAENKSK